MNLRMSDRTTLHHPEGFGSSDIQKFVTWNFQKKKNYTNFEDKHFATQKSNDSKIIGREGKTKNLAAKLVKTFWPHFVIFL